MHLFWSLLEARWGTELTVSGSSTAIHPEVQKVTPECEACRLMEAATENVPHSRHPLSIVAVLTPTSGGTSKQILFIHDYFQEMHVRSVLDFIKNEGGTVTEASSTDWRNLIHVCDILVSCCLVIHCPKRANAGHVPTYRGNISVGLKNTPRMDGLATRCCLTVESYMRNSLLTHFSLHFW